MEHNKKKYQLGQKMDTEETLEIEYKEFCLKKSVHVIYSEFILKEIIETSFIPKSLYNLFEENLKIYFYHYLPKYITMFSNTMNLNYGKLYFGISDNGEITGIPFLKGKMGYPLLENWIQDIFKKFIFFYMKPKKMDQHNKNYDKKIYYNLSDEILTIYLKEFKIIIHPLETNYLIKNKEEFEFPLEHYLKCIDQERKQITFFKNQYTLTKKEWIKKIEHYKRKIVILVNDFSVRNDMYHWAIKNGCNSKDVFDFLLSKKLINDLTTEQIIQNKNNPNSYIYWILEYRDSKINEIIEQKPTFNYYHYKYHYYSILNKLKDFRYTWNIHNKNLKYYIIEFQIPAYETLIKLFDIEQISVFMNTNLQYLRRGIDNHGEPRTFQF